MGEPLTFAQEDKHILQWNSVITYSVANEHSGITNSFWSQIGHLVQKLNRL